MFFFCSSVDKLYLTLCDPVDCSIPSSPVPSISQSLFRFTSIELVMISKHLVLSLCLFNLYEDYIMRNAGLEKAQVGIKIARKNINNLRYADDTILMAESKEELKSLLMKVKEKSENFGLKPNIEKSKIMASCPITSWEIDGTPWKQCQTLFWEGSKITVDGDCSHEIKRCLLLGRKVRTNLDSILKNRDITLPTKVRLVQAIVFPIVMYGCESWSEES